MEKALFTIGVFAGIFDSGGSLLLRRRNEETYFGKWELPGGALQKKYLIGDEKAIRMALCERVRVETGLNIIDYVQAMPAMYPTIHENDIAFAIIVGKVNQTPTKGEIIYVTPSELQVLAVCEDLVSGQKRMYRMCLRMFVSRDCPNLEYRRQASEILKISHK